jgi:glucose-1-phosphate thymidylyltransferase
MQHQIIEYTRNRFGDRFDIEFVEQESAEGLGHSIYQARSVVNGEPLLIALGDMLFENGYQTFLQAHADHGKPDVSIGVKQVDDPRHYGVVELGTDNTVRRLVEKPTDPPSDYAISGVYIVQNSDSLFDALEYHVKNGIRGAGDEFQLTDALQRMIEAGDRIDIFEVEDWYDCGRPETLLEANRVLLSDIETDRRVTESVIIPPVDIGESVSLERSIVGPYVSVDNGATISDSLVRNSIIGRNTRLDCVNLEESIVGDNTTIESDVNQLNVGDNSAVQL